MTMCSCPYPVTCRPVSGLLILACSLAASVHPAIAQPSERPQDSARDLYQQFLEPAPEMRPYTRWWWNDSRVNSTETVRELEMMERAGIMGVEINTIAAQDYLTDALVGDYPEHEWLGEAWTQVVQETVQRAHQLGMEADLIVGSGWPFGGEFLEPHEQSQRMRVDALRLEGPMRYTADVSDLWKKSLRKSGPRYLRFLRQPSSLRLAFLRLVPAAQPEDRPDTGVELLPLQDPASGRIRVEVPKGDYVLYVGFHEVGFTSVKHGVKGSSGPVVDHYNKLAVRHYLDHMSDSFRDRSGHALGDLFRATFVDSLELDHANWTADFPEEFQSRRGYPVWPLLPFVLDFGSEFDQPALFQELVERARHDYVQTVLELFQERFMETYVEWAEDNGLKARIQAYGREPHPLHASMLPHLPEGESWLWYNPDDERGIRVQSTAANKLVSSAAQLTGKRLVSFEAMTNPTAIFRESLDDFKLCMDLSILDGLNHPILHGFNYSPAEVPFPGWIRFGSYLHDWNPSFRHFREFSDYVGRVGTLLRSSDYQAQIAVLNPLAEEWSRHGMLYQPFPAHVGPWYQYRLIPALQKVGLGAQFVSEQILQQATAEDGLLRYGRQSWKLLVLQDVGVMGADTAEALARFHAAGGYVAFIGQRPYRSAGLANASADDQRVRVAIQSIQGDRALDIPAPVGPRRDPEQRYREVDLHEGDETLLVLASSILEQVPELAPGVRILNPDRQVSQLHHRTTDGRDLFFFVNLDGSTGRRVQLQFAGDSGFPVVWDPVTGQRAALAADPSGRVDLDLGARDSVFIVLDKDAAPVGYRSPRAARMDDSSTTSDPDLAGEWQLHLKWADSDNLSQRSLRSLRDLRDLTGLGSFGGLVVYRNGLRLDGRALPEKGGRLLLDLGEVNGTTALSLNGHQLGVRWFGRHVYDITSAAQPGANLLEVEVTTVLANMIDAAADGRDPLRRRWAKRDHHPPMGLTDPIQLIRETAPSPQATGRY